MADPVRSLELLDHLRRCPSCAVLVAVTRNRRDAGAVSAWRRQVTEHLSADVGEGAVGDPWRPPRPA